MHDVVVIGGGIVGMATAMAVLRRRPGADIVVLEKEPDLARHQSSHNSGVVHAGVYYEPGSLKAELCRRGSRATQEFCAEHGIDVAQIGKLVVATDDVELHRMSALQEGAERNGPQVHRLGPTELTAWEPAVTGRGALFVPASAITDYAAITRAMARVVTDAGGSVRTGVAVTGIREDAAGVTVVAGSQSWRTAQVIACAGLQADRVAALAGLDLGIRVLPFRGEYFALRPERRGLVTRLIYPVPDPALPFLGVHLTPMVDGGITVGPNAVLGRAREGYRKSAVSWRDLRDIATAPGFWPLARAQWRTGAVEVRDSLWRRGYLRAVRRYCPELTLADLRPYEAGIRAQAVRPDGSLVHDFTFGRTARTLHVGNAPSPAATSAIPIGELVAERAFDEG